MTTATPSELSSVRPAKARKRKWFYTICALILLGFAFAGFHRFFLRGHAYAGPPGADRPLTPPIKALVIAHGIAMSGWIIFFLIQPLLIASKKYKLHMNLGWVGGVLAASILVLGMKVGVDSDRFTPAEVRIWEYTPHQFMTVPVFAVLMFAVCVALGIWKRKKPDTHKALMLLATLVAMPAAVSRIETMNQWYYHTIWQKYFGPYFWTMVIGAAMVLANWVATRRLNRVLAGGIVLITLINIAVLQLAVTPVWDAIANQLLAWI